MWLPLGRDREINASHLFYAVNSRHQYQAIVKGAWGLSVLLREGGIFTATSISTESAVETATKSFTPFMHVGNLPDKELRYLRTVIVTAAVYRGLSR